ncbi:MAG TPA: hypothetical protein PKN48_01100 [Bacteroidales bacterium]|mgnify:CR=1 FL=1|nr:hypothetical protein [Bacteroidales bacterium]
MSEHTEINTANMGVGGISILEIELVKAKKEADEFRHMYNESNLIRVELENELANLRKKLSEAKDAAMHYHNSADHFRAEVNHRNKMICSIKAAKDAAINYHNCEKAFTEIVCLKDPWIPVTIGLPEVSKMYSVTFEQKGHRWTDSCYYGYGIGFDNGWDHEDGIGIVVAWKEHDAPYEG